MTFSNTALFTVSRKAMLSGGVAWVLWTCAMPLAQAQFGALAQQRKPAPTPSAAKPAAPVEPDSPRASLDAYYNLTRRGQWVEAVRYLALNDQQKPHGVELAKHLKGVLDQSWIDLETVSGSSGGRLDDGLSPNLEEVQRVKVAGGGTEPVRLIKTSDDAGSFWAFSPGTVGRIDGWYASLPNRWIRDIISDAGFDVLLQSGPFEILWWQWLAFPLMLLVAWFGGWVLGGLTPVVFRKLTKKRGDGWRHRFIGSLGPPVRLAWATIVFAVCLAFMTLTPPALHFLSMFTKAGMSIAFFWALWRSTAVLGDWTLQSPWAVRRIESRNLVTVGSNLARGAIFVAGALGVMTAFGYPFGTLLAGLGIGGLAVAFGAQKTIENVFGSVALAVDQPFHVGDFVKVEDFVGTVEDIGLRSTRFRTLDRTLITIPNGKLSEQRLESFTARDRMRFAATIGVEYGTTNAQMQQVLDGFERTLRGHPKIWPEAVVVKLMGFGANSLDIEIMAWFEVPTWGDFQVCRQEILLSFMKVVEDAGTGFAFPTRTIHLIQEGAAK